MPYVMSCQPLVFADSRMSLWPEFPVEYTCPESSRLNSVHNPGERAAETLSGRAPTPDPAPLLLPRQPSFFERKMVY